MNNVDVTSLVIGQKNDVKVAKEVTFTEPKGVATMAFKVYENNEWFSPDVQINCVASRAGSPWTFDTTAPNDGSWSFVKAQNNRDDVFPSGAMLNEFAGAQAVTTFVPLPWEGSAYYSMLPATSGTCTIPTSGTNLIRPAPSSTQYNIVRKVVDNSGCL